MWEQGINFVRLFHLTYFVESSFHFGIDCAFEIQELHFGLRNLFFFSIEIRVNKK